MPVPSLAVAAAIALVGGAAVGVGLEQAGVLSPLDEPVTAPVRADRVAVLDCPEGVRLAMLTRGDRIVAIGRSEDGAWIEIRSPIDLEAGAWLPTAAVVPDGDRALLDDLPEAECDRTVVSTTTSSTSTSSTSTSTSTTTTSTTTTTVPRVTTTLPPRPTTTPTTPTPLPPDVTPPSLGQPSAQNSLITERNDGQSNCAAAPGTPVTSLISAVATDDRAGLIVTMTFTTPGGPSGSLSVSQQGPNFFGVLGPFDDSLNSIPGGRQVTVSVRAADAAGNQSPVRNALVQLNECV